MAESHHHVTIAIDAQDETTDWLVMPAPGENHVSVHVSGTFTGTLTPQTKLVSDADAAAVDETDDAIDTPGHYNFVLHGPCALRLKATAWTDGAAAGAIHR